MVTGNITGWEGTFPDFLIPEILSLLTTSWQGLKKPSAQDNEEDISRHFCLQLRMDKNYQRNLPVRVEYESREADAATGEEVGRIDIRFSHGYDEDVYLSFECKKLNVLRNNKIVPLSGKYVTEGMMRYITGKYASFLAEGGMIGYVMDGKVDDAVSSVNESIKTQQSKLFIDAPRKLSTSSVHPSMSNLKETTHNLAKGKFVIHHLFLSAV